MNYLLIAAGVAGLVFWWLNRKAPAPTLPDNVTPERKNKFEAVESCYYTLTGLSDNPLFKQNEEAQDALATLKTIVVEALK